MAQVPVRPRHGELVSAAVRLFREKGYHDTSMQDLAEAVGVQRGSLYHYIEAKEDLLWEIMERALGALFTAVEPVVAGPGPAAERLRGAIAAHLGVAAALRDELTILHVELKSLAPDRRAAAVARRDRYEDLFRGLVREGRAAGEFRRGLDAKSAVFALLGACNWFTQWYRPAGPKSHREFAAEFADLFLHGLAKVDSTPGGRRPATRDGRDG